LDLECQSRKILFVEPKSRSRLTQRDEKRLRQKNEQIIILEDDIMTLTDIRGKDSYVKEVESNVKDNSESLKLPKFCSRLSDYHSYDY
jgi:hypothetical protein